MLYYGAIIYNGSHRVVIVTLTEWSFEKNQFRFIFFIE
jgi:hypothetical protein